MAHDGAAPWGEYVSSDILSKPDPAARLMMTVTWISVPELKNPSNSIHREVQTSKKVWGLSLPQD